MCLPITRALQAAKYTFRKSAASPLDAQHCQLMQLVGSALLVTASAAASLALAAGGRWGRLSPEGTGELRGSALDVPGWLLGSAVTGAR